MISRVAWEFYCILKLIAESILLNSTECSEVVGIRAIASQTNGHMDKAALGLMALGTFAFLQINK